MLHARFAELAVCVGRIRPRQHCLGLLELLQSVATEKARPTIATTSGSRCFPSPSAKSQRLFFSESRVGRTKHSQLDRLAGDPSKLVLIDAQLLNAIHAERTTISGNQH